MSPDVIGAGRPCIDLIARIEHLPGRNESLPIEDYSLQGGGKVATALVTLARLGNTTGMVGRIGDDIPGRFVVNDFWSHGVETIHLKKESGGKTAFSLVLSDTASRSRSILWKKGELKPLAPGEVDYDYFRQASFVHLAYPDEFEFNLARFLQQEDVRVVYDGDFFAEETLEMLPLIDVFIASREFAAAYSGLEEGTTADYRDLAREFYERGPEIAVITLGKRGAIIYSSEGSCYQKAYQVETVDTTGAGDVYHGAFIHGLLRGKDVRETARIAAAAAAIKTTAPGGRAGIPTRKALDRFLRDGRIEIPDLGERINYYRDVLHNLTEGG